MNGGFIKDDIDNGDFILINTGTYTMTEGTITNVDNGGGIFTMTGGTIGDDGSYEVVANYGTFTFKGGLIKGSVWSRGETFTMEGGTINSGDAGMGVYNSSGTFTMTGGTIKSKQYGVDTDGGIFTMTGGTIDVGELGDGGWSTGICVWYGNITAITGGTIRVYNSVEGMVYGIYCSNGLIGTLISNTTIDVGSSGCALMIPNAFYSGGILLDDGTIMNSLNLILYNCVIIGTIDSGDDYIPSGYVPSNIVKINTTPGTGYTIEYYENQSAIATSVQFQTWCDADKAGTTFNYQATKQTTANGTAWVCTVDKSNHQNKTGAYTTDVYATTSSGTSMVMDISGIINI
ncbi:MAG: GBS Bsp-like repeat-containing protein [Oscillospiraceae bacterium]|nr:GBS Bsp-like repeat-containing protein [Oscillospiraceae bacterium]